MDRRLLEVSLKADENAQRDIENRIDLDSISQELGRAKEHGLKIIPYIDKNKVPFAQLKNTVVPSRKDRFS